MKDETPLQTPGREYACARQTETHTHTVEAEKGKKKKAGRREGKKRKKLHTK